jgi:hypothetical protein
MVLAEVIVILIIVLKVILQFIIVELFVGKCLARKPVDRTRDELLLNIFAELIVKFQTLLNVGGSVITL